MVAGRLDVRRLTFQGTTTRKPAWTPRDPIAFSGRRAWGLDGLTLAWTSGKVTRLTQNQGTIEKPAWAPNGRYLCLFSKPRGKSRSGWMCCGRLEPAASHLGEGGQRTGVGRCPVRRAQRAMRSRSRTAALPAARRGDVDADVLNAIGGEPAANPRLRIGQVCRMLVGVRQRFPVPEHPSSERLGEGEAELGRSVRCHELIAAVAGPPAHRTALWSAGEVVRVARRRGPTHGAGRLRSCACRATLVEAPAGRWRAEIEPPVPGRQGLGIELDTRPPRAETTMLESPGRRGKRRQALPA